MGRPRPRG